LLVDTFLAFSFSQFLLIHVIDFLAVTPHKLLSPLKSGQEVLGGRFEEVGNKPADLGETAIQEAAFQPPHPWSLQHIPQSNIHVHSVSKFWRPRSTKRQNY
jgi:hypothetical protein